MTATEIRSDMRDLDEVIAKLREARKRVEAYDNVSLLKKAAKSWGHTGRTDG